MSGSVNAARLIARIRALGQIGRDPSGRLTRLAGSDQDRTGRDQLAAWARQAGLTVQVDRVGNMLLVWEAGDGSPIMIGSHIDTVIDAGIYDGCYGVLAGLEVVETLREQGVVPRRPVVIAAFTNEEGVRFAPDMMGSLVYAGGLSVEEALGARATDGAVLGAELSGSGTPAAMNRAGSDRRHTSNFISSKGRSSRRRGSQLARSRTSRASPGSGSRSRERRTMPGRHRRCCGAMQGMPRPG